MRSLMLIAALLSFSASAGDLSPQEIAKIQNDQAKANEGVDKKYGGRKANELSSEERRQMLKDKGEAERAVLEKNGTDSKSFAHASSKLSREDRAASEAASKDLARKDADAKATDGKKAGGKKEIVIEKNGQGAGGEVNEAAQMDQQRGLGKGQK